MVMACVNKTLVFEIFCDSMFRGIRWDVTGIKKVLSTG
jgi:hypothetical protein